MNRKMSVLADFDTFLSKSGADPQDKIKFYLYWVRRFLKSCDYKRYRIPDWKYWIPDQVRNDNQIKRTFEAIK